jgi:NAD(P)-dependent dehydrogenase (short-subunit alcohol dehydrogenase family)
MRLKDLSVAITGSGRGIGRSIAICCADEGARVVINDIHSSNLQEVRNTLESKGVKVVAFKGDISKRSEAQGFIEAAINGFGRIDVLVNNAGIAKFVPFLDITEEDWDEVMRVNLKGVFHCAQSAVRYMVKQGSGRIINISSRAYLGTPQMAHYASSKAGILGLTRSMAMELGPYGITVNAVAPGMIDTELLRSTSSDDFIRDRLEKIPLHKFGSPEDIAHAVVFLASSEATYITGEVLHVTGGLY